MRKTTKKIKWLVSDLGLNELDAWLWMIGGAALTAAVLVLFLIECFKVRIQSHFLCLKALRKLLFAVILDFYLLQPAD